MPGAKRAETQIEELPRSIMSGNDQPIFGFFVWRYEKVVAIYCDVRQKLGVGKLEYKHSNHRC